MAAGPRVLGSAMIHLAPGWGLSFAGSFVKGTMDIVWEPIVNAPPIPPTDPLRRQAGERALGLLQNAGFARIEPAILQPADAFLDLSGEEIRGRLYFATDSFGAELCLRPDYTIPICLMHLASAEARSEMQYSYFGPVFRSRAGLNGEMIQTGLESFGRRDVEAADAEILGLALEASEAAGSGPLKVKIGDARILDGVLSALGLPDVWRRRVRRGLAQGRPLELIVSGARQGASAQAGALAALERVDHLGARALVTDLLAIAGFASVGGRSTTEIADRFLEQATAKSDSGVGDEQQAILQKFLAVTGHPDAAATRLRELASETGIKLDDALESFEERVGFMAARGLNVRELTYSADFIRDLDYYTGFIFEAVDAKKPQARPAIGGGRYDGLARQLGGGDDLLAVGAAIWLDRLPLEKTQ